MAKSTVVTYECTQCGSEIIVTEALESQLSPIYCCGMEVAEVHSGPAKAAKPKKRAVKKPVKKTVKATKKTAAKKTAVKSKATLKKKTAAKKKTSKK